MSQRGVKGLCDFSKRLTILNHNYYCLLNWSDPAVVTHQWPAKSIMVVPLCSWDWETEILKNANRVWLFCDCSRTLSLYKPCLTRSPFLSRCISLSLSLTRRHQHQQRAVTLNKSHPSSTWQGLALFTNPPHTPSALLINHSLSDENKGRESVAESFFFVFSADISRQLYVFLSIAVPVSSLSLWHII